jgi:hypothetical protein
MFSKLIIFALSTLALFATAIPTPGGSEGSCSTGPVQCCNSVQDSQSEATSHLLNSLGLGLQGIVGQVGLGCTPVSVIDVASGGSSWSVYTVIQYEPT